MDKLTVLNNALILTGNNEINALNDGSDEWRVTNAGFGRAIRFLTARHNWPFAQTVEPIARVPDVDNKSQRYPKNGFRLPVHYQLIEVYHAGVPINEYEVIGSVVSCDFDGDMSVKIVVQPADAAFPPYAEEVLTLMVEAACYKGLNEDGKAADGAWSKAENLLFEVRPRADQTNPGRNIYRSSIAAARRTRRR